MAEQLLDEQAIGDALKNLDWSRDGNELVKSVVLADFSAALKWVNQVGELAEQRNHHPDINIAWNRVTLRLSTHSAGGLTSSDIDLATAIDNL